MMKQGVLSKKILLGLCFGGTLMLVSGCSNNHDAPLDGGSGPEYPYVTEDDGETTTYKFSHFLGIEDKVVVRRDSGDAITVQAEDKNIRLTVSGNYRPRLEAHANKGNNSYGAYASDRWIRFENPFFVQATSGGGSAFGLYATNYGSIYLYSPMVETISKNSAVGVYANNSLIDFSGDASVRASAGKSAYGVDAERHGEIYFAGKTNIAAASDLDACAVSADTGARVVFSDFATIAASAVRRASGVYADGNASVRFGGGASITAKATGEDGRAYGAVAYNGGAVEFRGPTVIEALNGSLPGFGAVCDGGTVAFYGAVDITGDLYASGGRGSIRFSNAANAKIVGDITAVGGAAIRFGNGDNMISGNLYASGGALEFSNRANVIEGNLYAGGGKISFANGENHIDGDLTAGNGGTIDFARGDHTIVGNLVAEGGTINLNMTDGQLRGAEILAGGQINLGLYEKAVWENAAASRLSKLDARGGQINQNSDEAIEVGALSGGVKVNYQSKLGAGGAIEAVNGGRFIVHNASANSWAIINTDAANIDMTNTGAINFALTELANKLEYKASDDHLSAKATINEGKLTSSVSADILLSLPESGDGNQIGTPEIDVPSGETTARNGFNLASQTGDGGFMIGNIVYGSDETATMRAIKSAGAASLLSWRAESGNMSKRLEELRNHREENGVWAGMFDGELKYDEGGYFKNEYRTVQVGYDKRFESDGGAWFVGGAASYTDGSVSFERGGGDNSSIGLGLYGSWLGKNGHFFDLALRRSRLDTKYDYFGMTGSATSGAYDQWATSVSAEYGRRIALKDQWYIEPQAELTYGRVSGADYLTSDRIRVSQDDMDSLVGRLGFSAGRELNNGNRLYLSASILRDFDGKTAARFSDGQGTDKSVSQDFGGTWLELGLGANFVLSDRSFAYAGVGKSIGGDVKTPWKLNAGIRCVF